MDLFSLLFAFVAGTIVLVLLLDLRGRVQNLEDALASRSVKSTPAPVRVASVAVKAETPSREPDFADKFIAWVEEDWLLKLGALLLLIGFGWLTTYAFLNNWIGPMERIALGIVAGVSFLILGWRRIQKFTHQGGIFLVLGSTTILLTVFAAREIYDFFTPFSALAIILSSTAFVAFASIKQSSRSLSLLNLGLAGIAPMLVNAPGNDYVSLFSYLLIVVLGTIWVLALTGRRELTGAALLLVVFYSLKCLFESLFFDSSVLLPFVYAFSALFLVTNTMGLLKLKESESTYDLLTVTGNGLFLLTWVLAAAPDNLRSSILGVSLLLFLVAGLWIFKTTRNTQALHTYARVAIVMLTVATSIEFSGALLTIALTLESALIVLLTHLILNDVKASERSSALLLVPIILSNGSLSSDLWATGIMHVDSLALLVLAIVLFGLGLFLLPHVQASKDEEPRTINAGLLTVGSVYVGALFYLCLHSVLQDESTAIMISLVVYTIMGLCSYFYGLTHSQKGLQWYGGFLVGSVVARLLLVDIWMMELSGRIITFFLIGALLVSTAFFGKKRF